MPDLMAFLQACPSVEVTIVGVTTSNLPKCNCFQLRGKLSIELAGNRQRPVGFKFILPPHYPKLAPYVYLDEPIKQDVIDNLDYIDAGNRIMFQYLTEWAAMQHVKRTEYCLNGALSKIYNLFKECPPLSFEEIFGSEPEQPRARDDD